MKELIFHLGTPKTGSSALQVFLARNAEALMSKSFDYLQVGEIGLGRQGKISSGNAAFLARSLFPLGAAARMKDPERYLAEFRTAVEQSRCDAGIVSSEMFVDVDRQALAALCDELRSRGIVPKAFYFIRSQVQSLSSAYVQQVKRHGYTGDPATYMAQSYKIIHFLKYHTYFRSLVEIFGPENVFCRTYDMAIQHPGGLFRSFLSALEIDAKGLDLKVEDINTSMAPKEISIMLLLNRLKPLMKFSDLIVENAARMGSAASGQTHSLIATSLAREIEAYFEEENAALARSYFHREQLFPQLPDLEEPEPISVDDLTSRDLVGFFGGLLVRYDERLTRLEERLAATSR